jgi:hypothetical protein
MCARRFLTLVFILTLIFVGGALALYQWGDQVLVRMATPRGHYRQPPKSSDPDYRNIGDWADWPDPVHGSTSLWLPGGKSEPIGEKAAATFYVHPTTYLERDQWNAPMPDGPPPDWAMRIDLFIQSQASAFNGVSNVWAPSYRQAAYGAFLLKSEDASKALDLAYRDVLAAFEYFLGQQPGDKPIILAAHSQGSLHLLRLLSDRKDALRGRLVAAYVVGWPVGVTADLPATGLSACAKPDATACVMSWQSFKDPANTHLVTEAWVGTQGLTGRLRTDEDMLCTNPLTGTKDGAAAPGLSEGTLVPNGNLTEATLEPGRIGARCHEGFLMIDGDVPNLGPYVLPGNNYHVYDYALFWGSIRADVERRLAAWGKR